jgi:proteasome assembly chaperone 4
VFWLLRCDAFFFFFFTKLAARRFKKQIFLSVDVPAAFTTLGDGPKLLLAVERAVMQAIQELETQG